MKHQTKAGAKRDLSGTYKLLPRWIQKAVDRAVKKGRKGASPMEEGISKCSQGGKEHDERLRREGEEFKFKIHWLSERIPTVDNVLPEYYSSKTPPRAPWWESNKTRRKS